MIILYVKLLHAKWSPRLRTRFDSMILKVKDHTGHSFPIRNVIRQVNPRTLEILSESYTVYMIQNIRPLLNDISFPCFHIHIRQRKGWNT